MATSDSQTAEKAGGNNSCLPHNQEPLNEDQQELSKILRSLKPHPDYLERGLGIQSLGEDGVLRSLTAGRDVVDAVALSPRLIKALLDRMPFSQEAEDKYRGVDGTKVPREQWFHPDKSTLPAPLPEDERIKARKRMEDNRELIEERLREIDEGTNKPCGPVVRSNYNLGPKKSDLEGERQV